MHFTRRRRTPARPRSAYSFPARRQERWRSSCFQAERSSDDGGGGPVANFGSVWLRPSRGWVASCIAESVYSHNGVPRRHVHPRSSPALFLSPAERSARPNFTGSSFARGRVDEKTPSSLEFGSSLPSQSNVADESPGSLAGSSLRISKSFLFSFFFADNRTHWSPTRVHATVTPNVYFFFIYIFIVNEDT